MDLGKIFKRQKSTKDKGKRTSDNRNSQRTSTASGNQEPSRLNQRRPSHNAAAGTIFAQSVMCFYTQMYALV